MLLLLYAVSFHIAHSACVLYVWVCSDCGCFCVLRLRLGVLDMFASLVQIFHVITLLQAAVV